MEFKGTIKSIGQLEKIGQKQVEKVDVIVETNEEYPQLIPVQMFGKKADFASSLKKGVQVSVSFNLRGKEWTSPKGEIRYILSVIGERIERLNENNKVTSSGDLPF